MTTSSSADNPPEIPNLERRLRGALEYLIAPGTIILDYFGVRAMMLGSATAALFRRPFRLRLFLEQMEFVGVGSLPIILLVGFFSGAVSAQQAINALRIFNQERFVGATVGISLAQELAPVFTGLMITARAGSGMATELGSMRITEQFTYWTDPKDYTIGALKALVFGVTLSVAACYQGFNVRGGAKEVGLATTRAVVAGSVSILVSDYFLIDAFHILWPYR